MLTKVHDATFLPWIATIFALGAWWVSWRESRRNNRVIVKLTRFDSRFTRTEPGGGEYELEVWLRNAGIQIPNITVSLVLTGPGMGKDARFEIPLADCSKGVVSPFLRGSTAAFLLSKTDKAPGWIYGSDLRPFEKLRPVVNVHSGSFLVCSLPVYRRWERLRKLRHWVSSLLIFRRRVADHSDAIRTTQLHLFLEGILKDSDSYLKAGRAAQDPDGGADSTGGST